MKKVLLAALVSIFFAPFATAEVNVVSWGGAYTESQKLGYGDPYQEKSGVKVNWIDYSGGLSEVRTQVESGNVTGGLDKFQSHLKFLDCLLQQKPLLQY